MVTIKVENLTKQFAGQDGISVAVDGVSFEINNNEILSLVGPSGCGKTTTLRCIAGLEHPTSGKIFFNNVIVNNSSPQNRNVAMLFQDVALWNHMTTRENLAYPLKIQNVEQNEIDRKVTDVAHDLKIGDKLDQSPQELSGGQQQRVALGRAVIQNPDLFLFDEPLSALDAALKEEIRPLIQKTIKRVDAPAIYVTHDQEQAMTISDKIAVMRDGKFQQFGEPRKLYQNPSNRFIAEFIGNASANIIESNYLQNKPLDNNIEINGIEIEKNGDFDEGVLAIRPENIQIENESYHIGIPAEHTLDEPRGHLTHSHFETTYGEMIVITNPEFEGNRNTYKLIFDPGDAKLLNESEDDVSGNA